MLFGTKAAEFSSDYPLDDSVARLSAIVKRSVFSAWTKQELVGKVSQSKVSVQRVIPFFGNSFKPFFVGNFQTKDDKVVLRGNFTMHPFTKIFTTIWFAFCMFFMLIVITSFFRKNSENGLLLLGGITGLMLFGGGIIYLGRWISHGDVAWISIKIAGALSNRSEAKIVDDKRYSKTWLERNWKVVVPIGIIILFTIIIVFVFGVMTILKSSSAYTDALVLAKSNSEIKNAIGEPIKEGFFVFGNIQVSSSSGNTNLAIPIAGSKGKATVFVQAEKSAGKWEFVKLEVLVDKDKKRVNLLINR